mmetsp:Transcript_39229/g.87821  ORF Transcript_39229/g.87821 Transcript_39229/m.87821 type:complete len:208 (+) Transcript_39229:251-874(+)
MAACLVFGLQPCALLDLLLDAVLVSASALKHQWGDEPLDLWSLVELLVALHDLTANDVLTDIILLVKTPELADLVRPLWAQTPGLGVVGQAFNLLLALLQDNHAHHSKVGADDAAADGLTLAAARAALTVARHPLLEHEAHTVVHQDALLHGEALLVVASANLEHVALPLIAQAVAGDLRGHALVEEWQELLVILNLELLLAACGWV